MSHLDLNQLRTDFKATESRVTRGGREPIPNIFNLRPRFIVHSDFSVSILSSKGPFFNLKFSKLKVLLKRGYQLYCIVFKQRQQLYQESVNFDI